MNKAWQRATATAIRSAQKTYSGRILSAPGGSGVPERESSAARRAARRQNVPTTRHPRHPTSPAASRCLGSSEGRRLRGFRRVFRLRRFIGRSQLGPIDLPGQLILLHLLARAVCLRPPVQAPLGLRALLALRLRLALTELVQIYDVAQSVVVLARSGPLCQSRIGSFRPSRLAISPKPSLLLERELGVVPSSGTEFSRSHAVTQRHAQL
jgi:hypothetical protein